MSDERTQPPAMDAGLYACLYQPALPGTPAPTPADAVRPATNTPGVSPLIAIAAEFSPRYEQHRASLVAVDVRGLSRLLGTPKMIGVEMRREAASRGLLVHVAVAPTRMAALLLSIARPGLTVVPPGGVADALASVPLTVLEQLQEDPLPAGSITQERLHADEARASIAVLKRWGLRTLGELAALPAADLAARLGRSGRRWQSIARGEDTRPLVPMQPEERFEGMLDLEWPIEGAEPLSFVLTRLLEPLSTRLERRDRGAAVLHVELGLVTKDTHASRLELPSPLRDVRALRTLALLDFEAHPPSAAIDRVTVTIEPTPGRILQHALFARPHPTPEQLSTLLARLGALMGQDRVGAPAVVDSFRPGAFTTTPFAISHAPASELSPDPLSRLPNPLSLIPDPLSSPISAVRRCRQPIPARVSMDAQLRPLRVSTDRRGFAGGTVLSCAGPWRTSGAWWEDVLVPKLELRSQNLEVNSEVKSEVGTQTSDAGTCEVFTRDGDLVTVPRPQVHTHHAGGPEPASRSRESAADQARSPEPEADHGRSPKPGGRSPESQRSRPRRESGPWSRDEWDVSLADGAVYRIFRDRVTDGWFIDGVVD